MKRITKKQYRDSARTASTAEVKPRPNKDRAVTLALSKSRRDDTLLTVCFSLRYGVALRKSRRDDISVENSTLSINKSRRDDMSVEGNGTFAINKSQTTNNCQLSISYAALTGLNCQLSQSWSSCKSYENHGSDKSARNDEPHS